MKIILAPLFLAIFLCDVPGVDAVGDGVTYTYFEEGGLGPSRWQFLDLSSRNNQCGGTQGATGFGQSPVTVNEAAVATCDTDTATQYTFNPGTCTYDDLSYRILNNGVIVSPSNDCLFGSMEIPHTNNPFTAVQFHIHTFSEHEIVGQGTDNSGFFPAELHVVHVEDTDSPSFAVFGSMMDVGEEDHPFMEWFIRGWENAARATAAKCPEPEETPIFIPRQEVTTCLPPNEWFDADYDINEPFPTGTLDLYNGLPSVDLQTELGFYTYKGGLTTPACTEAVNWNLADKPILISANQLKRMEQLIHCYVREGFDEDDNLQTCFHATVASETGSTSRPPQPLAGRTLIHRCPDGPQVVINDVGTPVPDDEEFVKPELPAEPQNTREARCERRVFEDCSGEPREDPRVSPNLRSTAPVYEAFAGLWIGKLDRFNNVGDPLKEVFVSPRVDNTLPYPQTDVQIFVNVTVFETRLIRHVYYVFKPASKDFCALPLPDGASNVLGDGECGVNGYSTTGSQFATATFEKDGVANLFSGTGRFSGMGDITGQFDPVDGNTLYSLTRSKTYEETETQRFTNGKKTRIAGSGQYFIFSDVPPFSENPLAETFTYELNQVSEVTFKKELESSQQARAVPSSETLFQVASGENCVVPSEDGCPSEEDWQMYDPLFNQSPYDESTDFRGGYIALFVIVFVLLLVVVFLCFRQRSKAQQENRYKSQFAERIALTTKNNGKHDKLKSEELERVFKEIDVQNNGEISKRDLKLFVGDKMNDRDFEAMFSAIDLDHNYSIDFTEFCAFMAQIGNNEEEVHV